METSKRIGFAALIAVFSLVAAAVAEAADCSIISDKLYVTNANPETTYGRKDLVLSREQVKWTNYVGPKLSQVAFVQDDLPGTIYCDSRISHWLTVSRK